jgi:hypothetical protein
MPGHHYTHAKFTLQRIVETLDNLLLQLKEHHLTHTYQEVFRFCDLECIDYLVLRYLNTGGLPFQESYREK